MEIGASRSATLQALMEKVRRIEEGEGARRAEARAWTGVRGLDALAPAGGFRPGALIEWLGAEGAGSASLAWTLARTLAPAGRGLVVVDRSATFYPPAAASLGWEPSRTVVLRPRTAQEECWALEQTLRCPGVGVALAWVARLPPASFRRLKLAAEAGGGFGLLVRPASSASDPSWADVRFRVESLPVAAPRRLRVETLYVRGGASGRRVELEMDDETGAVRLAPPLVAATIASRAAGA